MTILVDISAFKEEKYFCCYWKRHIGACAKKTTKHINKLLTESTKRFLYAKFQFGSYEINMQTLAGAANQRRAFVY